MLERKQETKIVDGIIDEGEKPRPKDLLDRPLLKGGAAGEQAEFLEKEKYRLPKPDIEGQMKFEAKKAAEVLLQNTEE